MSAKRVADLTRIIDKEVQALEASFTPALTGAVPIGFFTGKASQAISIAAKANLAKNLIPPAPGGLVKRSQFGNIEKKLKGFSTEDFPTLETHLVTFLTSPEPTTRATALTQIGSKIPGILLDYVIMKNELRKVKKALRI